MAHTPAVLHTAFDLQDNTCDLAFTSLLYTVCSVTPYRCLCPAWVDASLQQSTYRQP